MPTLCGQQYTFWLHLTCTECIVPRPWRGAPRRETREPRAFVEPHPRRYPIAMQKQASIIPAFTTYRHSLSSGREIQCCLWQPMVPRLVKSFIRLWCGFVRFCGAASAVCSPAAGWSSRTSASVARPLSLYPSLCISPRGCAYWRA
eukprot:gene1685-biopygen1895